jgi:aspartyl-tRNA synthetase
MHAYRTHFCHELNASHIGQTVRLSGWVHRRRDHGGLMFIDLRDLKGLTQIVIEPNTAVFAECERLRSESVITVTGTVVARPDDTVNHNLPTGMIEIAVTDLIIQSAAEELPMPVFGDQEYPEEIRLKYRYLDLRREKLRDNILLRSQVISSLRRRMTGIGFNEFQTPILTASSPEGARDFLVPARLHPGKFYALPQAPQQFKQLTMVAGFDKYFQIAPCFRDEDARADRSPGEFYQLDIEMSFVTQEDVFATIEPILHGVFTEFGKGKSVTPYPFPRISYTESLLKYGSDKPDLRNPIVITDITTEFSDESVTFKAFQDIINKGGVVRAIPAPTAASQPRSFFDKLNEWARKEMGAAGLGYIIFETENNVLVGKGPIAKFIPSDILAKIAEKSNVKAGDALFLSAGKELAAAKLAGQARIKIGQELNLRKADACDFDFCWVVDFPMYEYNEDEKRIDFSHNPFSMPQGEMDALEHKDPLDILAYQYDIVCNGIELSSGAIRNHRPDIMYKAFEVAGYGRDVVENKFGGMLNAFKFGAPPHGGLAPGIDRMVMILAGAENIRDITLFPMNQKAEDLMMQAPAIVDDKQLRDIHIKIQLPLNEQKTV